MKVIILAGGFGTRISEYTGTIPKPMIKIGEKPMLWHIMKIYSKFGFKDFYVALGHKGEIIKEYFSDGLNISKNSLIGPTGTFNGFDLEGPIERRIDYIFTKGIDILSYMHIDQKINNNRHISDHLPVMIKMR